MKLAFLGQHGHPFSEIAWLMVRGFADDLTDAYREDFSDYDAILSVMHPRIISEAAIESVRGRAFNLHNAAIPDHKGFNAITHEILGGEKWHTTTLHWMAPKVDEGDIAYTAQVRILPEDTAETLFVRSADSATLLIFKIVGDLLTGRTPPRTPCAPGGEYHPRELDKRVPVSDAELIDRYARSMTFKGKSPPFIEYEGRRWYLVGGEGCSDSSWSVTRLPSGSSSGRCKHGPDCSRKTFH